MVQDKRKRIFRKAMNGMRSMTLLVFLFLLVFYLFPRFVICLMFIFSIPFMWRFLPRMRQTG